LTPCIFFYIFFPKLCFSRFVVLLFLFSEYYLRSHVFSKLLISPGRGRKSKGKN
jgi:hypothetical protein